MCIGDDYEQWVATGRPNQEIVHRVFQWTRDEVESQAMVDFLALSFHINITVLSTSDEKLYSTLQVKLCILFSYTSKICCIEIWEYYYSTSRCYTSRHTFIFNSKWQSAKKNSHQREPLCLHCLEGRRILLCTARSCALQTTAGGIL